MDIINKKWLNVPNYNGRYYIDLEGNLFSVRIRPHNKPLIRPKKQVYRDYMGKRYTYLKDTVKDLSTRFEIDDFLTSKKEEVRNS